MLTIYIRTVYEINIFSLTLALSRRTGEGKPAVRFLI